jgi:hypothetical protein
MYSIHIYLFIYSESLIFGKMYDKETFFSAEIYLFSFYMQIDYIYSVCLKKNHDSSYLINQKSSEPPLSISNFFLTPLPITFLPPPLDINNDRSLSDPRKIGLSIFNFNFSHCGFYVLGNNHFLIWGGCWDFLEKNISMP